jgi:hypothetical protein
MVIPSIIPAVDVENKNDLSVENVDNKVKIETFIFFANGTVKKSFINISIAEFRNMEKLLRKPIELNNSINTAFNEKLSILKKFGIINEEISADVFSNSFKNKFNFSENKGLLPRSKPLFGNIFFNIFNIFLFIWGFPGFGVGFGLNSYIPAIGFDWIDLFYLPFAGYVTAFGVPQPLMFMFGSPLMGIVTSFIGVITRVLYPFVYGPFICAMGLSGPTFWIKGIPFIPFI